MRTATVTLNGEKSLADGSQPDLYYTYVQPNYFRTLNIPISLGIGFTEAHGPPVAVAILSESAAKELWPGNNPIGRELVLDGSKRFHAKDELTPGGSSYRVIGIARDTRAALIDGMDARKVYLPLPADRLDDRPMLVRTEGDPEALGRRHWKAGALFGFEHDHLL